MGQAGSLGGRAVFCKNKRKIKTGNLSKKSHAPTLPRFGRRLGLERQRVQAGFQFGPQGRVHEAVPRDGRFSVKRGRHDLHPKMGLPAARVAGVAGVQVGLVDDGEGGGGEGGLEFAGGWLVGRSVIVFFFWARACPPGSTHQTLAS